jgi:DNA-directed RNA polymerase subunit RPC12/RpoP
MQPSHTMGAAPQPLTCPQCGAGVPIVEQDAAVCHYCGAHFGIPERYRQRLRELQPVRTARVQAELQLRQMIDQALPRWLHWGYALTVIPSAVIGVPLALGLTQSSFHWFAREWVVVGGLAPTLVTLLPWLVLWAKSQPWLYLQAVGGQLRPGPMTPDGQVSCGSCGAVLRHSDPEALAVTCDYCGSDNWISEIGGIEPLPTQGRRHRANLTDLMRAQSFQRFDIRLLLYIYVPVVAVTLLLMWFMLPGRG